MCVYKNKAKKIMQLKKILKTKMKNGKKLLMDNTLPAELFFLFYNKPAEIKAEQEEHRKKKRKTTWIFLLVNVVIVAAIFIYQFCFGETKPLSELFAEKPFYRFFFISLGVLAVYYLVIAISYSILFKQTTGKFRFWLGLQFAIVGKYWDNITPFGSGGQFGQVAHGRKKGIPGDKTTSIVVGKYMINMLAFVSLGIAVLFIPIDTFTSGNVIKWLALAGVIINLLLTLFIWIVSTNRKLFSVIVGGGIKILHKMHIIKDYQKALYKSMRFIKQYQQAFKYFIKKPWVVICEFFLNLVEWIAISFIPYLIYLAFNFPDINVSVIPIIAMSILCTFATSYIPIPGGSGMAEISFAALFSKLFTPGVTFWALIFWRIFTYYLFIIIGFVFTLIDPAISKKAEQIKERRAQKLAEREQK